LCYCVDNFKLLSLSGRPISNEIAARIEMIRNPLDRGNAFGKFFRFCAPAGRGEPDGRAARRRGSPGYSLIELLIVLAIIGLIAGLVGPRVLGYLETSKVKSTRLQIDNFGKALDLYFLDVGRYPSTAEGLDALVRKPGTAANWAGPYLKGEKVPADPWGSRYNYRSPGEHGKYDLYSFGADGRDGGTGTDADITSWDAPASVASNEQR
jgi:general secretion pathway protein G